MKRLNIFVLSVMLALGMLVATGTVAYAEEITTDPAPIEDETPSTEPEDPVIEPEDPVVEPEEPGWHEADGSYYYILDDGNRAYGLLDIDGATYWFDEEGIRYDKGWKQLDGEWRYFGDDGVMWKNRSVKYLDNMGYFDASGILTRGWFDYDGGKAYADSNGIMYQNRWLNYGGKWYYFGNAYKMLVNSYTTWNGAIYCFGADGTLYLGWWEYEGAKYYSGSDGKLYCDRYLTENGKTYYFEPDGKLQGEVTGKWVKYNGYWYYQFNNGSWAKGWNQIDGKWYFFSENYDLRVNTWIKTNGYFYCVGSSGYVLTNTTVFDGAQVDANGRRISGPTDTKAQGYSSSTGYLILVNYTYHTVSIYTGSRNNWKLYQCYRCSLGKDSTKTPTGTFYTTGRTYSFGDNDHTCYYATGYIGMNYLMHSVLYYPGTHTLKDGRLGLNISGGCIRLHIDDAKWIYNNVPLGTPVVIYY